MWYIMYLRDCSSTDATGDLAQLAERLFSESLPNRPSLQQVACSIHAVSNLFGSFMPIIFCPIDSILNRTGAYYSPRELHEILCTVGDFSVREQEKMGPGVGARISRVTSL